MTSLSQSVYINCLDFQSERIKMNIFINYIMCFTYGTSKYIINELSTKSVKYVIMFIDFKKKQIENRKKKSRKMEEYHTQCVFNSTKHMYPF